MSSYQDRPCSLPPISRALTSTTRYYITSTLDKKYISAGIEMFISSDRFGMYVGFTKNGHEIVDLKCRDANVKQSLDILLSWV